MAPPLKEWKVLPHGPLTAVDTGILTVVGRIRMPAGDLPRRMTVVRLRNGGSVIFSAVALNENAMRALEEFGQPAFLVVPNGHHRLDARAWKNRYPALQVVAPAGARAQVEKVVPVDATHDAFDDPDVVFITVAGTRDSEAALEIRRADGLTLVLNDVVGNIRDASGFGGWFLRVMGFAGDAPHVPLPVKLVMIKDKAAFAAQLRRWAELPSLKRILVSHGQTIEDYPQGELRKLASSLG